MKQKHCLLLASLIAAGFSASAYSYTGSTGYWGSTSKWSGGTSGSTSGRTSGSTSGTTSGSTSGSTSGTTSGSTSGSTSGTSSGTTSGSTSTSTTAPARWQPRSPLRWQIQYDGNVDTSMNVDVYDIDLFDTSASTISMLHAQGKKVICYINAGAYENWRPDASKFPTAVIGKAMQGWAGENWLNVANITALTPVMTARMDLAKQKGCDAVDPDNVDGYTQNSGFTITAAQQIAYNRFLATEAHNRGLAVGLKNDVDQVADLVGNFDFAVNESCSDYNECSTLAPFTQASKPVFAIEYTDSKPASTFCPQSNRLGFNGVEKNMNLDAWMQSCL